MNINTSIAVLAFDPGDHTGWCYYDESKTKMLEGGTLPKDYLVYEQVLNRYPDAIVIVEDFHLYASKAQSLTNNTFYTCEVIGILKYLCAKQNRTLKLQQPANKKYINKTTFAQLCTLCDSVPEIPVHPHFKGKGISEHTRDAIKHLIYFLMNYQEKDK